MSHADERALLAVPIGRELGVDIEHQRYIDVLDVAREVFSPAEHALLVFVFLAGSSRYSLSHIQVQALKGGLADLILIAIMLSIALALRETRRTSTAVPCWPDVYPRPAILAVFSTFVGQAPLRRD